MVTTFALPRLLGALVVLGFASPGHAQDCAALYRAIRAEARDCGFFCDQAALVPLQIAYENRCIVAAAPPPCGPAEAMPLRVIEIRRRLHGADTSAAKT